MPFRSGKMSGVINNGDGGNNEMSYVDMHDLHPENVQAAQMNGFVKGAVSGGILAAIPASLFALTPEAEVINGEVKNLHLSGKNIGFAAAIVGFGAALMGTVKSFTYKKEAETHNAWSETVLKRMEKHEENAAKLREDKSTMDR